MIISLGTSDDDLKELGQEKTILGVLQDFGNKLQEDLRNSLQSKITTLTPKTLEQSIVFDIKVLGTAYQFELKMEDYWEFVDKGVQGVGGFKKSGGAWSSKNSTSPFSYRDKKPPLSELEEWSYYQGANPYVVQNSVYHKGTKATNFYSEVVDGNLVNQLMMDLEEAGAREVEISLKNGLNGNSN